jgi:hypothetical protein
MSTNGHARGLAVDAGLDDVVDQVIEDLESEVASERDAQSPTGAPLTVRDATGSVLASLARVPASRIGHHPATWPLAAWDTPPVADHHVIASPAVSGSDLDFVPSAISPDMEHRVLEVMGISTPQLFAVSWPRALTRTATSGPTPFVVYFRPTVGPNVARGYYVGPGLGAYPFGWDYLFYGLWRYVNYMGDPLTVDPYAKGLPYQMSAAERHVALVLPLNRHPGELGVFLDAAWMQRILTEIQGFMFRQAGVPVAPPLGRVALAAFSSGNSLVARFLGHPLNQRHSLYLTAIRELYMFDAPPSGIAGWVSHAIRWSRAGSSSDKMIRVFARRAHPSFPALLGAALPAEAPFLVDSAADRSRTVAVLPETAWRRATTTRGAPGAVKRWQDAHQLISATMLTDALRRSGF